MYLIKKIINNLLNAYQFIKKNKLYNFDGEYLDIHGGNIMKDKNGNWKIIDF